MPRKKKEHLKRRKDGRYRCIYKGIPFYSYVSEDEALALRDEYKRNEEKGFRRQTVADYALPWLKRTFPAVADSTYSGYAVHLQHLIDEIGNKEMDSVIPSDIKSVYSNQYSNCSNSYLIKAKQLFVSLFDSAVADRITHTNPARDKTAKPHKGSQPKTRPITRQEREWIETLCTDHRFYPAVMAMLYAGLRPQEVKAIKIERDVDFKNNTITVNETAHKDGRKYEYTEKGKTDKANRQIPLFPPLKSALEGKKGYLVSSAHGERVTETTWKVVWTSYKTAMETAINGMHKRWYGKTKEHKQLLAEKKPLPKWQSFDIVPYDLRHSFCSWCRDNGVEMNTCRKWMGHSDPKMILKVYDSVSDDRSENERKRIEKTVFQVQDEVQPENETAETVDNKASAVI